MAAMHIFALVVVAALAGSATAAYRKGEVDLSYRPSVRKLFKTLLLRRQIYIFSTEKYERKP
jgi:hypothetical protein